MSDLLLFLKCSFVTNFVKMLDDIWYERVFLHIQAVQPEDNKENGNMNGSTSRFEKKNVCFGLFYYLFHVEM